MGNVLKAAVAYSLEYSLRMGSFRGNLKKRKRKPPLRRSTCRLAYKC